MSEEKLPAARGKKFLQAARGKKHEARGREAITSSKGQEARSQEAIRNRRRSRRRILKVAIWIRS